MCKNVLRHSLILSEGVNGINDKKILTSDWSRLNKGCSLRYVIPLVTIIMQKI